MGFTRRQVLALHQSLGEHHVREDRQGNSYIEQWFVRAQLTRLFGDGNWDLEYPRPATLVSVTDRMVGRKKDEPGQNVIYVATARLTVRSPDGEQTVVVEGSAAGEATMGVASLGDCHDGAVKNAESYALKRAAMNLGTQFGLSLYADGSLNDVTGDLVIYPAPTDQEIVDAVAIVASLSDYDSYKGYWGWCVRVGLSTEEPVVEAFKAKAAELKKGSSQSA